MDESASRKRLRDDADLPGLKRPRAQATECESYVSSRSFKLKTDFNVMVNKHTHQRWLYNNTNSRELMGVVEGEVQGSDFGGWTVRYRKPRCSDWHRTWDRARVEASKYFAQYRAPHVENSARQRALPENNVQRCVDFYPHYGVERAVGRMVPRALGGDESLYPTTTHCNALVFTGRDPFGATTAVVVECAPAMRALRVPCTWPAAKIKSMAGDLCRHLGAELHRRAAAGWKAKRELGEMWVNPSAADDGITEPPPPILRHKVVLGTGVDLFGFRGTTAEDAGLSFVEIYFSHTYYAEDAQAALVEYSNSAWLPPHLLPNAAHERGEYYAPHHNGAFRIYDPITALESYMCDDGRRWGSWYRLALSRCIDMTDSKTAEEGRVTLCDREYRCAPSAMQMCDDDARSFVNGKWRVTKDMVADLLLATIDTESRPPADNSFPQPHADSLIQISYHTDNMVSGGGDKHIFTYGRLASAQEFEDNLEEVEEAMETMRSMRDVSEGAATAAHVKSEQDGDELQDMIDALQDLSSNLDEERRHMEKLVEESIVDASALDDFDEYFTRSEREEIDEFIVDGTRKSDTKEQARLRAEEAAAAVLEDTDAILGTVHDFDSELEMLYDYAEFWQVVQANIVTAWYLIYDAQVMLSRALALGSACMLQLGLVPGVEVKTRTTVSRGKTRGVYEVSGCAPMCMLFMVLNTQSLDAYNLNHVASRLIGRQKATMPYEMIHRLARSPYGRRMLAIYCSEDSALVVQIARKLRPFVTMVQECRETNNQFASLVNYGSEAVGFAAHRSALRQMGLARYTGCTAVYFPLLPSCAKESYEGGAVFKPHRGDFVDNTITILDLNALYPNITRAKNLCTTTMVNEFHIARLRLVLAAHYIWRTVYDFDQSTMSIRYKDRVRGECGFVVRDVLYGVLPELQEGRYEGRKVFKAHMATALGVFLKMEREGGHSKAALSDANFEVTRFNGIQATKKKTMNETYGIMASPTYRLYALIIPVSITTFGRLCVLRTAIAARHIVSAEHGYAGDIVVVYGDTDSIMVHMMAKKSVVDWDLATGEPIYAAPSGRAKHSVNMALGPFMAEALNEFYVQPSGLRGEGARRTGPEHVGGGYAGDAIEIKFENGVENAQFDVAKHYLGIFNDGHKASLIIKGHGAIRRDAPYEFRVRAKEVMYLHAMGARAQSMEHARAYLEDIHLEKLSMPEMVCTLKLSKPIEEYKTDNNAVCAARRFREYSGALPPVGTRFAAIAAALPKTPGKKWKKSEHYFPLEVAIASDARCDPAMYKDKFLSLVLPVLKYNYDGDEGQARRALLEGVLNKTTRSAQRAFEERVEALEDAATSSANAARALRRAKGSSILSHFTARANVRCQICRALTAVSALDQETAAHHRANPNADYYCPACAAKSSSLADIEDLYAERDSLRHKNIEAHMTCIACQKSMGIKGPLIIKSLISKCEATTCTTYIARQTTAVSARKVLRRIEGVPRAIRMQAQLVSRE